eukprot:ANDGO_01851.mRNA.1 hypothetical protein
MRRILSPSRPVAERKLTKKFLQKNYKLTGGIKLAGSSIQGLDVPSGSDVDLLCRIMLDSSAPEPASRTVLKQFASFVREQVGIHSAIRNRVSVEVVDTEEFEYDLLPAIFKDGKWKVPSRQNDSAWDDSHLDDEHRSTVAAVSSFPAFQDVIRTVKHLRNVQKRAFWRQVSSFSVKQAVMASIADFPLADNSYLQERVLIRTLLCLFKGVSFSCLADPYDQQVDLFAKFKPQVPLQTQHEQQRLAARYRLAADIADILSAFRYGTTCQLLTNFFELY